MSDRADAPATGSGYNRLVALAYLVAVLCAFSLAREVLLPIVLAIVLSFLLTPIISRLEQWGFHPVVAVLCVVAAAFAVIAVLCGVLSAEAINLANSIPKYRGNIEAKWAALQQAPPGPLNLAFRNIGGLVNDLAKSSAVTTAGAQGSEPTKVQIVGDASGTIAALRTSITPLFGHLAEFAVVVVLVVFSLFERERLRERFLRLMGHSRAATTTLALDEASFRLGRFLLMQLVVNSVYALLVALGLTFIGIPNALLWAILTLVLRFLPYIGLWISAFFPIVLSIAISTTWTQPVLTLLLYVVLEIFTNNIVEPVVLGGSTGISPLAVIVSALFWTWIWGPIGLLLATPITACLVVLGRYFPAFLPYSVLLAADPPSSTETELLNLFAENRMTEARALLQELVGQQLSIKAAEEVIVPTLRAIEKHFSSGIIGSQTRSRAHKQIKEVIDDLTLLPSPSPPERSGKFKPRDAGMVIVPFIRDADEIMAKIVQRLLMAEGIDSSLLSWRNLRAKKIEHLKELKPRYLLFSVIDPRGVAAVAKKVEAVRSLIPELTLFVGLWSLPQSGAARVVAKINESTGADVYTNLDQAISSIASRINSADAQTGTRSPAT